MRNRSQEAGTYVVRGVGHSRFVDTAGLPLSPVLWGYNPVKDDGRDFTQYVKSLRSSYTGFYPQRYRLAVVVPRTFSVVYHLWDRFSRSIIGADFERCVRGDPGD